MTINSEERRIIKELERKLKDTAYNQSDRDKEFADFVGLYLDIIEKTAEKGNATIIYDYAKLLEEQEQLHSAERAYSYGKNAMNHSADKNIDDAVKDYVYEINQTIDKLKLSQKQQEVFDEITVMLDDAKGLITEFTDMYRKVHGSVSAHISQFVMLGYNFIETD